MRKRCIRRHWQKVDPIALSIAGATVTTESDLDKLRMRELSAIENFSTGNATPSDFRDLCDMLNLAETMAGMGIGAEVLPFCNAMEGFLLAAKNTHDETGTLPMPMAGIAVMRDVYEYHDLQRTSVDRSTYERAIDTTRNRIRSAHPDIKVLA
jgi:hypothetical protein